MLKNKVIFLKTEGMQKITFICLLFISFSAYSQNKKIAIDNQAYNALKLNHQLDPNVQYILLNTGSSNYAKVQPGPAAVDSVVVNNCSCYLPLDGTYAIADFTMGMTPGMAPNYRCDDGYTPMKNLPFTFCN